MPPVQAEPQQVKRDAARKGRAFTQCAAAEPQQSRKQQAGNVGILAVRKGACPALDIYENLRRR